MGRYDASHGGRGRTDRTRTVAPFRPTRSSVPSPSSTCDVVAHLPPSASTLFQREPFRFYFRIEPGRIGPSLGSVLPFGPGPSLPPFLGPSALNSRPNQDTSLSFSHDPVRLPSRLTRPGRPRGYFLGELFAFLSALPRFRS